MKSVMMRIMLVSLANAAMAFASYGDEGEGRAFTVTFDLGEFGYAYGPLSQEVEYGGSAVAPEFFCDPSYDFVGWDKDFSCVTSDMVVLATYELSSVYKMIEKYSGGYGADGAFILDCIYYDAESHCMRAQGTLDDSYNYSMFYHIDNPDAGSGGSEHDGNLRMRIFCVDKQGNEVDVTCVASSWSCALPVDIDEVSYVGIELVSTWYSGEYCWFWMDASYIERARFNVLKIDMSEFDPSEYTYYRSIDRGSYYDGIKDEYHYYRQHEYHRSIEGIKPLTVIEIVNASNMSVCINDIWACDLDSMSYILKSSPLEQRSNVITFDKEETLVGTTMTGYGTRPAYYHETRGYSTFIVVDPEQYTARFDLCGHGERIGGGELTQNIDCLKGETEVFPEVRPNPHYFFCKWTRSHWDGNTLVYVAEYDREYVIVYEDTKGVYNPNPTNYMVMVTNEIVFAALADTDKYWFKGWEPARIEVGTTGDLIVTAKWERILPAIEGDESATVTGDAETGFVIKPSEGKTAVVVTIPQGEDATMVTVEVSPKVASVKPNGAKVKIVSGGTDITEFLNVPAADGNGVVDLTKATVREEIVKEVLDTAKGAVVDLCSGSQGTASPTITTAPTRAGLFYQLREGETLGGMKDGDSKVGDGEAWSPEIKVKGGNSAFYSIGVGKGE